MKVSVVRSPSSSSLRLASHSPKAARLAGLLFAGLCLTSIVTGATADRAWAAGTLAAGTHMQGEELDLSAPCAQVKIIADPALASGITLQESHGAAPQVQTTADGATKMLGLSLRCVPGARLVLRISPATMLNLQDSPHAAFTLSGPVAGLDANLTDASLTADQVPSLSLALHGTATAAISQLNRAGQIVMDGASTATVDQAHLTALSVQASGTAALRLQSGQIDLLALTVTDQAHASILATVQIAHVNASGHAVVTLGPVTGTLTNTGPTTVHALASSGPAPSSVPAQQPLPAESQPAAQAAPNPVPPQAPLPQAQNGSGVQNQNTLQKTQPPAAAPRPAAPTQPAPLSNHVGANHTEAAATFSAAPAAPPAPDTAAQGLPTHSVPPAPARPAAIGSSASSP
ncbi:hypothetical protein E3E11_03515 [Oecophyllibacter saccharovorans]|uniref:hypothetical protein n=1 Tax=Oecophyllibacter saccharovorans TaxID=2558360 RepID=UPI001142525B|nr:hypothetical protein [Oecophyllibacter saccharovorans]QDH15088.1 hypothetical protein E3E11_03515 [Oecophyllibacter saccharovorans]